MKRLTLAVFIFVGLLSTGAFANDQLAFNDALEAFNNAKAPTLSDFSGKLAPLAFAIEGDQVDKKASKKIMKSKLQLKIETDALGKMHIYDPNLTYSYNGEEEVKAPGWVFSIFKT